MAVDLKAIMLVCGVEQSGVGVDWNGAEEQL